MIMNEKIFCPKCKEMCSYTIKTEKETYPVKGENVTIQAKVSYCNCCGEQLWNDELDDKNLQTAYDAYRQNHSLLSPAEIREIREKYDVSQTTFARILGMGDKTITRYENGSIPDNAQNNLIALVRYPENFKVLVEKNKDQLSNSEYQRIIDALNSLQIKMILPKQAYQYEDDKIIVTNFYWGGIREDA